MAVIAALAIVVVFAALMFGVLAFNATLATRRARGSFARGRLRLRRDRALTVAAFLTAIALVLALAGVFL